jgi:beta-lactamase regulating signal transducer with metallopeptidase domain
VSSAALQQLALASGVTTFAALFVSLARAPLRGTLGARAAYWLWLTVPASVFAVALPDASRPSGRDVPLAHDIISWLGARADALLAAIQTAGPWAGAALAVWAVGATGVAALMILRQCAFVRSLGKLVRSPDGTWRSREVAEPMLLGALRPRVLLPLDFERRYSAEEREFVLAHELAHMRRGDTVVNALGTAWLCVFWFNPVMFWAMRLLRFDQDLACDAAVLAAAGKGRRGRYAGALLKAQLAGEAALPVPLACHWRSIHPLRRRIAALERPVAGRVRHAIGIFCVAALVASVSLAARAVQPPTHGSPATSAPVAASGARAAAVHSSGKVCPLSRQRALARRKA